MTLRGTASQIELAEWLFHELEPPPNRPAPQAGQAIREYRVSAADDVVQVFYLINTATVQQLQEIATLVRSIADIRRLFTYNEPRAVVLRGTPDQIALAAWLFSELDQPKDRPAAARQTHSYRVPGGGDDIVQVFSLNHAATVQDFQEVVTLVRSVTDIRRLFTYNAPREAAARGTADQIALAAWLFSELDQPKDQLSRTHEYRLPGGGEDVVRVFYLTHGETAQRLQEIAVEVRSITSVRRLFTYNAPRAMALRGTASQIAMADRLIQERDK